MVPIHPNTPLRIPHAGFLNKYDISFNKFDNKIQISKKA
jgi:hypothetical protein